MDLSTNFCIFYIVNVLLFRKLSILLFVLYMLKPGYATDLLINNELRSSRQQMGWICFPFLHLQIIWMCVCECEWLCVCVCVRLRACVRVYKREREWRVAWGISSSQIHFIFKSLKTNAHKLFCELMKYKPSYIWFVCLFEFLHLFFLFFLFLFLFFLFSLLPSQRPRIDLPGRCGSLTDGGVTW